MHIINLFISKGIFKGKMPKFNLSSNKRYSTLTSLFVVTHTRAAVLHLDQSYQWTFTTWTFFFLFGIYFLFIWFPWKLKATLGPLKKFYCSSHYPDELEWSVSNSQCPSDQFSIGNRRVGPRFLHISKPIECFWLFFCAFALAAALSTNIIMAEVQTG